MSKRKPSRDVVSDDDYYMAMAMWASAKSRDPDSQVGAYIVSVTNKHTSPGWNDIPYQINDVEVNWSRPEKYPYIIHAEKNAIRFADNKKIAGATIYVTSRPCPGCMLEIVASGIIKVVYMEPKFRNIDTGSTLYDEEAWNITKNIARCGHVSLVKYQGNINWIRDYVMRWESMGYFD